MTFRLKINLGNEAMQEGGDIAAALKKVAMAVDGINPSTDERGRIADLNGNTVGEWHIGR